MNKLFGNIFDIIDTLEFDDFCKRNKDYCRQYLFAGFQPILRQDYEEIFQAFQDDGLAEKNFIQQSTQNNEQFTQRMWELTVFHFLKTQGISSTRKNSGPDFHFYINEVGFDIECVAPTSGEVPRFNKSLTAEVGPSNLDERIVLRILQGLYSKLQHKNQGPDGLGKYIIALSTANIDWDFHTRRIYQALFGELYPLSNNHEIWEKTNNFTSLGLFRDGKYSDLSAIIYTYYHPNHFRKSSTTNTKIYMIHNPFAKFPVEKNIFPDFHHVLFNPNTLEIIDETQDPDVLHLGTIINI